MRHALLHNPRRRTLAAHRPRPKNLGRPDQARARVSDIVLAIAGILLIGTIALYAALLLAERATPS